LGAARPSSRKLRCRCEISARAESSSCDSPRRVRHQRILLAKLCRPDMNTCKVVARSLPHARMAHRGLARQETPLHEWLGVSIAIVSSALGGTAAAVTRYLTGNSDPLTLAILRWAIGFLCVLPVALILRVEWPSRRDWPGVAALGFCFFGLFFILYNIAVG